MRRTCVNCRKDLRVEDGDAIFHVHPLWPKDRLCDECIELPQCLTCERRSTTQFCLRCQHAAPMAQADESLKAVAMGSLASFVNVERHKQTLMAIPVTFVDCPAPSMDACRNTFGVTVTRRVRRKNKEVLWGPESSSRNLELEIKLRRGLPRVLAAAFLVHEYLHAFFALERFRTLESADSTVGSLEESLCHLLFFTCLSRQRTSLPTDSWSRAVADFWQRKMISGRDVGRMLRLACYLVHSVKLTGPDAVDKARDLMNLPGNNWKFLVDKVLAGERRLRDAW